MKIYDCFVFNDENHVLEIRLNELNKHVDYFVIIEFGENHQGGKKGKLINEDILKKFNKKIRYFYFEKFNKDFSAWDRENFQRNQIKHGILDASPEDIIIISDVDEIPILDSIDLSKIGDWVYAFSQLHSIYKLNLYRQEKWWIGTKLCLKKNLKSPQWLRTLKVNKKYHPLRIDKLFSNTYYKNFKIINNGGWHLAWLKKPNQIIKKINSFAHTELKEKFKKESFIKKCIDNKKVFFNETEKLSFVEKNIFLPNYISKNIQKYSEWILKE